MTRLAVLIPVFKNQLGLERSLQSLRAANSSFHVIVVDDGSPSAIVAPQQVSTDLTIDVLRLEQNRGIAGALNHGLRFLLDRGYEYVARLDAGDTVAPQRFERQTAMLDVRSQCAVVGSLIEFVDTQQQPLYCYRAPAAHRDILRQMHVNNCILHPGATIRVAALRELGLYSEQEPCAEDYELFLRFSKRYELAVIPEVLTRCEYALDGLSVIGRRVQQRSRLRLQVRYFDSRCWLSYYGVLRTLLALSAPHRPALRLKLAFGNGGVRQKPRAELVP